MPELHSFLGLVLFYKQLIHKPAKVAKYLHQLMGTTKIKKSMPSMTKPLTLKHRKFEWQEEHQEAFDKL